MSPSIFLAMQVLTVCSYLLVIDEIKPGANVLT